MIPLIPANQQLFSLSIILLFVVILLWALQYWIIHHGRQALAQSMRYWITLKQYFEQNKLLVRLQSNYPRFFYFLSRQFQRQHFYGLPLTLLFLALGYILALFTGLVEDVVTSDSIV